MDLRLKRYTQNKKSQKKTWAAKSQSLFVAFFFYQIYLPRQVEKKKKVFKWGSSLFNLFEETPYSFPLWLCQSAFSITVHQVFHVSNTQDTWSR